MFFFEELVKSIEVNWSFLDCFREEIEILFFAEKKIIDNSISYIEKLEAELNKCIKEEPEFADSTDEEERESLHNQYINHKYGYTENLYEQIKQNQRKAYTLSIFSFIEGKLKYLCEHISKEFNIHLKLSKDKNISYVEKYWLFLIKDLKIEEANISEFYNNIIQVKDIRNIIAHNNSIIKKSKYSTIETTKGLGLIGGAVKTLIITDDKYVFDLLENCQSFFKELVKYINNRHIQLKGRH